jgi:hypothetical protein
MSPVEKFGAKGVNPDLFHIFGSRCFCHIDKSLRRKNHRPKSLQCIFVGLDPQSVNGFVVYSPERHDLFVSTHVRFHDGLPYDGRYTDEKGFDVVYSKDNNVISDDVNKFMYLVGTNHVDPDDGLLYKIISVEEKKYPGQGTFIVGYRALVYPNGKVNVKTARDAYHIRDLECYYNDYIKSVTPEVNRRHVDITLDDTINGVSSRLLQSRYGSLQDSNYSNNLLT